MSATKVAASVAESGMRTYLAQSYFVIPLKNCQLFETNGQNNA